MVLHNKRFRPAVRLAASLLILLGSLAGLGAASKTSQAIPFALPAASGLRAFQVVSVGSGWVLIGGSLYWTSTAGREWRQLSPPIAGADEIRAIWFADGSVGWMLAGGPPGTGAATFELIRTSDGGQTWQPMSLALPADVASLAGEMYIQFLDAQTGWLVVKQATSSLFSLGTLFRTTDGGQTWQRLPLPAGGPIRFSSAQDGLLESGPPAFDSTPPTMAASPGSASPPSKAPAAHPS